jgi:hypothetical protein
MLIYLIKCKPWRLAFSPALKATSRSSAFSLMQWSLGPPRSGTFRAIFEPPRTTSLSLLRTVPNNGCRHCRAMNSAGQLPRRGAESLVPGGTLVSRPAPEKSVPLCMPAEKIWRLSQVVCYCSCIWSTLTRRWAGMFQNNSLIWPIESAFYPSSQLSDRFFSFRAYRNFLVILSHSFCLFRLSIASLCIPHEKSTQPHLIIIPRKEK